MLAGTLAVLHWETCWQMSKKKRDARLSSECKKDCKATEGWENQWQMAVNQVLIKSPCPRANSVFLKAVSRLGDEVAHDLTVLDDHHGPSTWGVEIRVGANPELVEHRRSHVFD